MTSSLNEKARRLGYYASASGICRGAGVSRRPDMNSPGGVRVEDPCSKFAGTGRW